MHVFRKNINQMELLIIKNTVKFFSFNIDDIYYFEKFKRKIDVVTRDKRISYYGSFIALEKALAMDSFCKCHKSYIVNLKKVFSIDKDEIEFFDIEDTILVSKNNKEVLIDMIENI